MPDRRYSRVARSAVFQGCQFGGIPGLPDRRYSRVARLVVFTAKLPGLPDQIGGIHSQNNRLPNQRYFPPYYQGSQIGGIHRQITRVARLAVFTTKLPGLPDWWYFPPNYQGCQIGCILRHIFRVARSAVFSAKLPGLRYSPSKVKYLAKSFSLHFFIASMF